MDTPPSGDVVGRFVAGLGASSPDVRRPQSDRLGWAVELLGRGPVEWARELVGAEDVRAGPIGRQPQSPVGLIPSALEETAVSFLLALAGQGGPTGLSEDQRDLVRSAVHQDVPFVEMRDGFRRLQRRWTRLLVERVEGHRPAGERHGLVETLVLRSSGFFDQHIDLAVAEYLLQRERLLSHEVVERSEAVRAIVAQEPISAERAGAVLGLPVDAHHLALVLFADGDDVGLAWRLTDRVVREAGDVLGCPYSLAVAGAGGSAWIWLTRETAFPAGPAALLAGRPLPSPQLRLAVGSAASGLPGFRRSHLAALDAMRIGRWAGSSGASPEARAVVDYRSVSLLALLSHDPERAAWFRAEELGPLAGHGDDLEDLRRTVLGYLETRSHAETAARLYLHRNTVRYRIQRAEQLLGHPLTERAEQIWAALRLLQNRPPSG